MQMHVFMQGTRIRNLGIVNLLSENRTNLFLFFVRALEYWNFAYRIAYFLHTYVYMLSRVYFAYFDIHRIRINNRRLIITIAVRAHDIAIVLPRECRTE